MAPRSRFDNLRALRVRLRRNAEQLRFNAKFGGDHIDAQRQIEAVELALAATEAEWQQLNAVLHKPRPRPPIRYAPRRA
jgi:hypothetical protein